ncbi:Putative intracellular protease/amidase [Alteracholeplasma palmae J233]|uniref:Putative intracellular protease/amidase n=1 Tax=Alteracholeplasma palmae (strain ATCC 49389 / J233) TaxID=1318466 RepID=U4KNS3_ALTPJ|nr:DJ-1 family glyoxalase III [Alteracholeplasma palmae]CCV63860.1 Putative intracellular protease/amidase [Alteracholeplasma palmae J233]
MKKGLIVLFDNVEDSEALATRALLVRGEIQVDTATKNKNKQIRTAYGLSVNVEYLLDEINPLDYDFLLIPGGKYVEQIIESEKDLLKLMIEFNQKEKLIAAICAGPRFLGKLNLLENKNYTCYPGCELKINQGTYHKDQKVVIDSNIITARSAGVVIDFAYEIIKKLEGQEKASKVLKEIVY